MIYLTNCTQCGHPGISKDISNAGLLAEYRTICVKCDHFTKHKIIMGVKE